MTPTAMIKRVAEGSAVLLILPSLIGYRVGAWVLGPSKAFPGWSQAISLIPGLTGVYLRRAFYRVVLPRCDQGVCVSFGTTFSHPTAVLGANVYTGIACCLGDVTLEDDVLLGSHVSVANGGSQHGIERIDVPIRDQPGNYPRVTVGRDTWIGDRAIILADVGKHCVIGAGAVVTRPVPDYAVAVGVPARVIRFRDHPRDANEGSGPGYRDALVCHQEQVR